MTITVSREQVEQIIHNQHTNPFDILGPHQIEKDGQLLWALRVYQPQATAVTVVCPEERREFVMHPSEHNPHFFECLIDLPDLSNYQLRLTEGDRQSVIYDPYAFKDPCLTEFDLYLFGEGNHHRIYEKLGAHLTTQNGISGVYFAVWAPSARNVSLLGDFNYWDGRQHQMRKGPTGVWELFVPELKEHDR